MKLDFRKWFETATSTGDVAVFARPFLGLVRRGYYWPWTEEDPFFKKKKVREDLYAKRYKSDIVGDINERANKPNI